jgi:hypothetical protein
VQISKCWFFPVEQIDYLPLETHLPIRGMSALHLLRKALRKALLATNKNVRF